MPTQPRPVYTSAEYKKLQNHIKAVLRKVGSDKSRLSPQNKAASDFLDYVNEGVHEGWLQIIEPAQGKHDAKTFKHAGGISGKNVQGRGRVANIQKNSDGSTVETSASAHYANYIMGDVIRRKELEDRARQAGIQGSVTSAIKVIELIEALFLSMAGAKEQKVLEKLSPENVEKKLNESYAK
jgi:hypothetical protein